MKVKGTTAAIFIERQLQENIGVKGKKHAMKLICMHLVVT